MNKCSCSDCELEVWKEYDKCILHCSKNIYQKDRHDSTLNEFYSKFILYILDGLKNSMISAEKDIYHYFFNEDENKMVIKFSEFSKANHENYEMVSDLIKEVTFIPKKIVFPHRNSRDFFDYLKILNIFKKICFDDCKFYATHLELPSTEVVFQGCIFHTRWSLYDYKLLEKMDYVLYSSCMFKEMVLSYSPEEGIKTILSSSQFDYSCIFDKGLDLSNTEIKEMLFYSTDNHIPKNYSINSIYFSFCILDKSFLLDSCKINKLYIDNSIFKGKFYINKQYSGNDGQVEIENLRIEDSIFEENFKLHNCLVEKVIIKGTDFVKHADFFKSIFNEGININNKKDKSINFRGLNFKGLSLFGDCEFHELLKFQYVTFENFSHFRRAKFLKGLDLDYTNIQKEMNFFDIEGLDSNESKHNTSQETYRIIKHNFAKIGNTIEANKYHALELGRHNKNVWEKGRIADGIVSLLFWITSNFSQSWLLPLFWIFIIGTITAFSIGEVSLASIIKYATITKMNTMDNKPILFVFNKASLGFLYYQFILSIRKNTRK